MQIKKPATKLGKPLKMQPLSEQEEFEFRLRAEQEASQVSPDSVQTKQPSMMEKIGTNLARPGAAVRERIRTLGKTGDINQSNEAADAAWDNPESSETYQNETLRKQNEQLDKSFVSKLPQGINELVRNVLGVQPSIEGMAKDFITDPVQLGAAYATEGASKALAPIKYKGLTLGERASKLPVTKILASQEGQTKEAVNQSAKAIEATEQLLSPSGGFSKDIKYGGTANMTEQSSKYIQPAKNYTEVTDQLELAKGFPMQERQAIYDSSTASSRPGDNLLKLIGEEARSAQGSKNAEIMRGIHTKEIDFINSQPKEALTDPSFLQSRKEYYQGLADEAGAYKLNPSQSTKARAYKELAREYQNKTYELDEAVRPLNMENAGLEEASTRASELAQVERGQASPSIPEEMVSAIRGSNQNFAAALIRKISGDRLFNKVNRLTKKIKSASNKSEKAQSVADLIEQVIGDRSNGVSLEYQKLLSAPEQGALPSPNRMDVARRGITGEVGPRSKKPFITRDTGSRGPEEIVLGDAPHYPRTGNLPDVVRRGIEPKRPSQIELSDMTPSEIEQLARDKYGVLDYGGKKESYQSPLGKLAKKGHIESARLGKEGRISLRRLAQRRKENG